MAWYEDLQSHFDFADFTSWCHNNNERQAARMANVWGMITAVHGDHVFNHVAAMQATSRQAKIVELVMSCTGGTHPLLANQSDLLDTAGRRLGSSLGGRSDQDYQNAADRVQAWGVNLEAVLLELVRLRDGVMGPEIERAYAAYLRDLQGRREEALGDERPKKTAKRLRKLRKHQRMKLDGSLLGARGGHDRGRFWLLTRAVDNRPILLVSDGIVTRKGERVAIDKDYINEATALAGIPHSLVEGYYNQDPKTGVFVVAERSGSRVEVNPFVLAFQATGCKPRTIQVSTPDALLNAQERQVAG